MKEQILSAFQFRHACKAFDANKKISEDDFNTILESGHLSPSSFGFEPWRFLVIENRDLKEKIKGISWGAQNQLLTASHYLIILARKAKDLKSESAYIQDTIMRKTQKLDEEMIQFRSDLFNTYQRNDYKMLSSRMIEDWAGKQTYIALGNMLTTAALLGIDSCPIEGFNYDKMNELLTHEGLLDNDCFQVSVCVSFGYRSQEPSRPKTRRAISEVVQWVK